jgi:hypothetical protein
MLKSIAAPFVWVHDKVSKFNAWVASIAPGIKTKVVTFLGFIGSAAASMQEYITGLPLSDFISHTELLIITGVLFSLAFWFRSLSK